MATSRPFAFNSGQTEISGCDLVGYLSIGVDNLDYASGVGGLQWWMGPDEDDRYIVCVPVSGNTQPTPIGNASVGFFGSADKTDQGFINMVNNISKQGFTTMTEATNWLDIQGYWTSYESPPPTVRFTIISGGDSHSLYIDNSVQTWSWGRNDYGQLGDNTIVTKRTPVAVCGNHTFCSIDGGVQHSLGVDNNGQAWSWGKNGTGQLGDNTIVTKSTPVAVCGNHTFCSIGGGFDNLSVSRYGHSFGVDNNGQVWSWGYNNSGELGDNTIVSKSTPVAVCGNHTFCSINGGFHYSFGIDNNGQAWSWGHNYYGQLGDNTTTSKRTPVAVCGNHTFCSIDGGEYHSLGIDNNGQVWSWGSNNDGQLGDNRSTNKCTPVAVCGNHTFCSIGAGEYHSLGIDNNEQVWSWGSDYYGQLGDNILTPPWIPNLKCTPVMVCI